MTLQSTGCAGNNKKPDGITRNGLKLLVVEAEGPDLILSFSRSHLPKSTQQIQAVSSSAKEQEYLNHKKCMREDRS